VKLQTPPQPAPLPPHSARSGIKILIADDHAVVRAGLKRILAEAFDGASFGDAGTAAQLLELVDGQRWDVVLLDISMPGRSGLDALKDVKRGAPHLPVLILSTHPEDQFAVRCLKAGAAGYMTKESAPEELVKAIAKVIGGGKYVSAPLAEQLANGVSEPAEKPAHEMLSDREYEVMLMIARGKTVKEIGADLCLSVKTISTYREHIVHKMNLRNNAEIIRYALQHGLVE
jgi:two-component system, NarL family, invasion response regulator UvrY